MSEGDQVYMEVDKVHYEVANMEFDKVAGVVVILMEMMYEMMVVVDMEVDKVAAEEVDFWYSQETWGLCVCVCVSDLWNASHYMQKRQSY